MVHGSGAGGIRGDDGGGGDGIRTGGGGGIGGRGMGWGGNGGGDEDRGGVGLESVEYQDGMGGGIDGGGEQGGGWAGGRRGGGRGGTGVGDGRGGDGDDRGRDHGVGDADEGVKGDRGNGGAVSGLLPEEVLSTLIRLAATTAWACCVRRSCCTACIPPASARWLVSAPVETTTPERSGRGGGHVPHATWHLVRAMEKEAHPEGCAKK